MRGSIRNRALLALVVLGLLVGLAPAAGAAEPDTVGVVDTEHGKWRLRDESGGTTSFFYGNPGDVPLVGDWNCDGVDTPGLYRPSDGWVYLRDSNTPGVADREFFFGDPGDVPLAGDWNGDGCDTLAVYRRGRMYLSNTLGPVVAEIEYDFGGPGDVPFVGDFDGDGTDDLGVYRPSTGFVHLRFQHASGPADRSFPFGNPGDRILAGDWTGDGVDTVGVLRPADCTFYLSFANQAGGADLSFRHGGSTMVPVAGSFSLTGGEERSFVCRPPELRLGAQGEWVVRLKEGLRQANFRPGDGEVFDGVTLQAVYAFQKYHGLARDGVFRASHWELLGEPARTGHVPSAPDRVEVDISRQILFLVRNDETVAVLPVSTGGGHLFRNSWGGLSVAHTPRGWFTFERNIEGWRTSYLGQLWRPYYFVGGYAVHGSLDVPTHPASAGCVRVTMWDMDWLAGQIWIGMPIHIYD